MSCEWRPISTAERNATWIIVLLDNGDVRKAHFAEDLSGEFQPAFSGWFVEAGKSFEQVYPTHWMPLPKSWSKP